MKKKKIRLVLNAIPLVNVSTGIGRYLRSLYSHLEALFGEALEVSYFDGVTVSNRMPGGPSDLGRWSSRVEFFWRLPAAPAIVIRLVHHLRREVLFKRAARTYDIYHEPGFFPFSHPSDLKTVFTIHDLSLIRFPEFHPRERVVFSRIFFRRRCRGVDRFVAVSDFTRREILNFLAPPEDKIRVVLEAHDPAIFYPRDQLTVRKTRARFSLPDSYFLFVGTGDPRKNLPLIPQALDQAGLRIPLVVAGWAGWSKNPLSKGNVIPLGYVSDNDLACLYSGALAFVFPSLYEGFGLPVLEAMACGCPVVCSRNASLPEIGGSAALYLENASDVGELAAVLKELASSETLRHELSGKSVERASHFSWKSAARETFGLFRELLGK